MASEHEFRMWLEALTRQNEREPLGYPERLELEQHLLQAFHEAKGQEKQADEALHNQIESQKADWEKAISSLRQAAEEKKQLEQQLAQARALLEEWMPKSYLETYDAVAQRIKDTEAFLAQHKEPSDGPA